MIRTIILAIFLACFFLISLPFYLILPLLSKVSPRSAQSIAQKMVCGALSIIWFICGIKVNVEGKERIPADQPVLYIGNHTSYFDIVTTYPLLPTPTGYVAKKEINKIALLKYWMRSLRGLTFDRKDPHSGMHMIMDAIEEIKTGYSIFIFPEGTRSHTGEMGEFKAGSFKIATRTNCPIIPVAISGTADIFENHMPVIRPNTVTITFGEPIIPSELSVENKKHIGDFVKKKIADMLGD